MVSIQHGSSATRMARTAWLMFVVLFGGCSSDDATGKRVTATIGAPGGSLTTSGGASIVIPAGAVAMDFTLTITTMPSALPPSGYAVVAVPLRFTPKAQTFAFDATITIPIQGQLPAGSAITDVVVFQGDFDSGVLAPIATQPAGAAVVVDVLTLGDFIAVVPTGGGPGDGGISEDASVGADAGPTFVFTPNADGTVTHTLTNLVWETTPSVAAGTRAAAAAYCSTLTIGGVGGYRLPSVYELHSILDFTRFNPVFDTSVFSTPASGYLWTDTPYTGRAENFASVDVSTGRTTSVFDGNAFDALCVRGTDARTPIAFVDNGDGTVTDTASGLVWQQGANPTAGGQPSAVSYCDALTLGGSSAWRLPTLLELFRLVRFDLGSPTLDATLFQSPGGLFFWSSTPDASGADNRYFIAFTEGIVNLWPTDMVGALASARCVR